MRFDCGRRTAKYISWLLLAAAVQCWEASPAAAADAKSAAHIAGARIGFKNAYKLGCWTAVTADVAGVSAADAANFRIEVRAADSDGVLTTATGQLVPSSTGSGEYAAIVYTQVGRVGSPIQVLLIASGETRDTITLAPKAPGRTGGTVAPVAATSEVIVTLGATPFGLAEAFADRAASRDELGRKLIALDDTKDLPTEWFGYEGVDVLILPAGDGSHLQQLAADPAQMAALERWVELGGRLVIFCGAKNAPAMLVANGPLARFAPGKFVDVVKLPETAPVEHYAGSAPGIGAAQIAVPRLADVAGNIELAGVRRASDLPLVVRTARGFGEITFVGFEFDEAPLNTWPGRTAFLRAVLRPYLPDIAIADATQKLVTSGFNDLSGALRQQLGRSFPQVTAIGFPVVAALVIAYLVFLGPLDYLLTQRGLRRPLAAWITFPLIIVLFAGTAVAVARWSRGSTTARVNQLEVIDVDTIGGHVRGTFWAAAYSPTADKFDFVFEPVNIASDTAAPAQALLSWWGLPGVGIGGMQTGGSDLGIVRIAYAYADTRNALAGVPVLESATKSLLARWHATSSTKVDATLNDVEGLVEGSITNQSGTTLRNARLLYGGWGYRLGNMKAGERIHVSDELSPRRAKTIVSREALGESGGKAEAENQVFSAEQASPKDILNLMMFYDTAGGFAFAHVPNRYQSYCDLSRQLELGRAVLVAEVPGPQSKLLDETTQKMLGDEEPDGAVTMYRYVLPVIRATPQ